MTVWNRAIQFYCARYPSFRIIRGNDGESEQLTRHSADDVSTDAGRWSTPRAPLTRGVQNSSDEFIGFCVRPGVPISGPSFGGLALDIDHPGKFKSDLLADHFGPTPYSCKRTLHPVCKTRPTESGSNRPTRGLGDMILAKISNSQDARLLIREHRDYSFEFRSSRKHA